MVKLVIIDLIIAFIFMALFYFLVILKEDKCRKGLISNKYLVSAVLMSLVPVVNFIFCLVFSLLIIKESLLVEEDD